MRRALRERVLRACHLVLAVAVFVSCSGEPVDESDPPVVVDEAAAASHSSSAAVDPLVISSNDGQKWKMDEHTRASFAKMDALFLGIAHAEPESLMQAARQLQDEINELTRGCTMIGPAHDELHVYLRGYIPAVARLAATGLQEDADEVTRYLVLRGDYFD